MSKLTCVDIEKLMGCFTLLDQVTTGHGVILNHENFINIRIVEWRYFESPILYICNRQFAERSAKTTRWRRGWMTLSGAWSSPWSERGVWRRVPAPTRTLRVWSGGMSPPDGGPRKLPIERKVNYRSLFHLLLTFKQHQNTVSWSTHGLCCREGRCSGHGEHGAGDASSAVQPPRWRLCPTAHAWDTPSFQS